MRNPRTGDFYTDFYGHYDVSDYEAEDFINWLIYHKKLESYSLLEELEYQISKEGAGSNLKTMCINTLGQIPLYCGQCHKMTLYRDGEKIYEYKTDTHRERISSSLVGGSNVYRKTTMTYATGWNFYCNNCLTENRRKYEKEEKSKTFKYLIKRIFGKENSNSIGGKPKKVSLNNVIKNTLMYIAIGIVPSFIVGAVFGGGNLTFAMILGGTVFFIF